MATPTVPPRRRRRPEEARQEILESARLLLTEQPAHSVTVKAIMAGTTLSRKSFYVYFRDRHEVIAALVEPLRGRGDEAMALWHAHDDPVAGGRAALTAVAQLYVDHGPLLRALFQSSAEDPEAQRVWRDFTEPAVTLAADEITRQTAAGHVQGLDPESTARALVSMNLRCFFDQLVDGSTPIDELVTTLLAVWVRVLYPERV